MHPLQVLYSNAVLLCGLRDTTRIDSSLSTTRITVAMNIDELFKVEYLTCLIHGSRANGIHTLDSEVAYEQQQKADA